MPYATYISQAPAHPKTLLPGHRPQNRNPGYPEYPLLVSCKHHLQILGKLQHHASKECEGSVTTWRNLKKSGSLKHLRLSFLNTPPLLSQAQCFQLPLRRFSSDIALNKYRFCSSSLSMPTFVQLVQAHLHINIRQCYCDAHYILPRLKHFATLLSSWVRCRLHVTPSHDSWQSGRRI